MAILSIGELLGVGAEALSGYVPYSAIEGEDSVISSINGSGLSGAGGTDTSAVSAIASAYAESAASGKADQSAFDDCCSSVQSAISALTDSASSLSSEMSGKLDNSASSTWYPSDNPSGFVSDVDMSAYVPKSGVEGDQQGYVTGIEGSAIRVGGGGAIASSYLYVDSGLELTLSGTSAILRTSGVSPAISYGYFDGKITGINGSGINGGWDVNKEQLSGSAVDAHIGSVDLIYTPSPLYTEHGSGSASATSTAITSVYQATAFYYVDPASASLPIPAPANQYSAIGESSFAAYYFTANNATAFSGLHRTSQYGTGTLDYSGQYTEGTPISTYTGDGYRRVIFFRDQYYNYIAPTALEATAVDTISAKFIEATVNDACIVKQPTGWISSNATNMDVGPTRFCNGMVSSTTSMFKKYYSSVPSDIRSTLNCYGYGPHSVHFSVELTDLPCDITWYLVQNSTVNGNEVLDMCNTYGSSGSVRMDAITNGRTNNDFCSSVIVSSVMHGYTGASGEFSAGPVFFRACEIPTGYLLFK